MGVSGWRRLIVSGAACVLFSDFGVQPAAAQVVAEPALLTAGVPSTETFQVHAAFPEDAFVIGGMIRFPVAAGVDLGGRAGMWFRDGGDDSPYAGGDLRYELLSRPLSPEGGQLNLSFSVGLGVSEPGRTVWKIPVGFLTGLGFGLGGSTAEVFVHPRFDFAFADSGDDKSDGALLLDVGGQFTVAPPLGVLIDLRFGDGTFGEGDQVVVAVAAVWRL